MVLKKSDVYFEDEDYRGRYVLFGLVILVLIIIIFGFFVFMNRDVSVISFLNLTNNSNLTNNTTNVSKNLLVNSSNNSLAVYNKYNYSMKRVSDIDSRACGATPNDLYNWFGQPLYIMGWEPNPNSPRGEPNSFKFFIWNQTVLFTSGRMNDTSGKIETYRYLARRDDDNRTAQKLVEC